MTKTFGDIGMGLMYGKDVNWGGSGDMLLLVE